MAQITNGHVSYERRVKTGEFEHKHAAVVIHYALDPGEDHNVADQLIAMAGALATGHVFQILRAKPGAVPEPTPGTPAPGDHNPNPTPEPVPDLIPEIVEVIPPVTSLKAAKRAVKAKGTVSQSDVVVEDIPLDPTPEPTTLIDVVEDTFVAEAPALTDAELGQALSRKNAQLKDRPRIQALIGEFVASGSSYTQIPGVRRAEFVSKLEALA